VVAELARVEAIPIAHRPLWPADVAAADEVLLASTSPCLLPVVRLDGRPLGDGRPGPIFRQLLAAFSREVGLDIAAQARQFAAR
jgi:branched-subunit amino acid aminotransferase/4-amino-4-deoxychorismate lyase